MKKKKEGKKELEIKDYSDIKSAIDSNSGGIRVCARLVSSHLQWRQRVHSFSDASLTDQCGQFSREGLPAGEILRQTGQRGRRKNKGVTKYTHVIMLKYGSNS